MVTITVNLRLTREEHDAWSDEELRVAAINVGARVQEGYDRRRVAVPGRQPDARPLRVTVSRVRRRPARRIVRHGLGPAVRRRAAQALDRQLYLGRRHGRRH